MSSRGRITTIPILPNQVRDFLKTYALSADESVDLYKTYKVVGLDLFIHNRGASSLTVSIDGGSLITILAGDALYMSNTKFSLIVVTSAVAYDLMLAGCLVSELDNHAFRIH